MSDEIVPEELPEDDKLHDVIPVSGMYENWFLDYASYVILERAVPAVEDGLKPVQRRILHAMKEMDDGRYNKVANIIGQTMQYHPHGDASIADAMVNLGQKELLIDTQGNWGDIRTGDGAAAPRYIEARPSKFALDVVYNPQTTDWQLSYDGRKKEPMALPIKFPLLLAQGVEGIAVGLSTKILPHNFCELIEASINFLKNKKVDLYPDFPTGGLGDFTDYNGGKRGGKIRVRAKIEEYDKKTLVIKQIPYNTTTTSLIESIVKANDKGKIKIKNVVDNTAKDVEILISLAPGQSPDITIDALYAFTDCELSISPNACVIIDDKPHFLNVNEILKINTANTLELLKKELEIRRNELLEKILFSSLEKIFIENRIYRDIEECETWESVIETIDSGLEPFKEQFYRVITKDDIVRLTEIKIKRISRFDSFKADELMKRLEEELKEVEHHLANLVEYAIDYFKSLLAKYGKGRERKTVMQVFDNIQAAVVAANNAKLYVNRNEGFVGFGLKKDEFVSECSDIDDVIVFRKDGKCVVSKISDKTFLGKGIIHVAVFKKDDERMVYNACYLDAGSGRSYVKRFQISSVTRDREYDLTKGAKGSKLWYFSANANGEAELITVYLTSASTARKKIFDFDFKDIEIKGRGSQGNTLTKYPVRKVQFKAEGTSTLGGLDIWYDDIIGRLNRDARGKLLGNFSGDDRIVVIDKHGNYELTTFELTNRYDVSNLLFICKADTNSPISVVHFDGEQKVYYVKRFAIDSGTVGKKYLLIGESKGSKIILATNYMKPKVEIEYTITGNKRHMSTEMLDEIIDVKGWKATGNKLSSQNIKKVTLIAPDEKTIEPNTDMISEIDTKEKSVIEDNLPEHETKSEVNDVTESMTKEKSPNEQEKASGESFEVGETIDLDLTKKDKKEDDEQLGLF